MTCLHKMGTRGHSWSNVSTPVTFWTLIQLPPHHPLNAQSQGSGVWPHPLWLGKLMACHCHCLPQWQLHEALLQASEQPVVAANASALVWHWFVLCWKHRRRTDKARTQRERLCVCDQCKHVSHGISKQGQRCCLLPFRCRRRIVCICVKRSCDCEQWFLFIWSCGAFVLVCARVILYSTV